MRETDLLLATGRQTGMGCIFHCRVCLCRFWATVCKMARPICYRTVVCHVLSVLSETLVYCGQRVRWIKMKLGMQEGLGPGHNVLDGNPGSPPQRGTVPPFSAHVCCGQTAGWIKMPLGTNIGLGPGDIVLHGDPALLKKEGDTAIPNFPLMSVVAKQLYASVYDFVRR